MHFLLKAADRSTRPEVADAALIYLRLQIQTQTYLPEVADTNAETQPDPAIAERRDITQASPFLQIYRTPECQDTLLSTLGILGAVRKDSEYRK